ncbi:hypothetical protein chiPu_0019570 [Chiloscyllium punctatum]|uniref:Uncharacterized protein n=1 Tax=Chiloscyllium punctatum TaxID=137246 RepID=A0A401RSH7_CHIPU|nr:hypothetical protein [Chiloscyllium punctatum]
MCTSCLRPSLKESACAGAAVGRQWTRAHERDVPATNLGEVRMHETCRRLAVKTSACVGCAGGRPWWRAPELLLESGRPPPHYPPPLHRTPDGRKRAEGRM